MGEKLALSSEKLITEVLSVLESTKYAVVSTENGGRVRARTVDYVNVGPEIGFYSWNYTRKIDDIAQNNKVAVTVNNVTIEGTAEINPAEPQAFFAKFQAKMPDVYARFTTLPDVVFIVVKPSLITKMGLENECLLLDHLDCEQGVAYRVKLSAWPKIDKPQS